MSCVADKEIADGSESFVSSQMNANLCKLENVKKNAHFGVVGKPIPIYL